MTNVNNNTLFKKHTDLIDLSKPVMISCESYAPFTMNNCVSDDGLVLYLDLMYFDKCSRNNNIYPADDTIRSFKESTWVQENLANRTFFGELEHPPAESCMERFMRVEPTRYAWNILTLEDKGDHFSGTAGLCAPLGTGIAKPNMEMYNANYGASCRISTPNFIEKHQNGRKIFIKKYKQYPISFDMVSTCGLGNDCRLVKNNQLQRERIDVSTGCPSAKTALQGKPQITVGDVYKTQTEVDMSQESSNPLYIATFTDAASEITKSILKSEENGKIISDIYGIDYDKTKAVLTKDNRIRFSMENGASATVSLNSYLVGNILNDLR